VSSLRVAAAQAASVAGDVTANVATAVRLTSRAADQGARLVLLPEAFLTGYDLDAFGGPLPSSEELDGAWLDPLRAAAADGDCIVVASTGLDRGATKALSLLVIRPSGAVSAPYDKQHLFDAEQRFFSAGEHGASITVDGIELGLSICYDGCFPEHARAAADDGALGYLNPSAYFPGSAHRRDIYAAARALDNGMYVVFSGLTGRCGKLEFIGGSAIYDPEGRQLARLDDEEGVVVADLDPAVVHATREAHRMTHDHLPTLGPRLRLRL
jgi:predicted amidohydrolase